MFISWTIKVVGRGIVDVFHNARLALISLSIIRDNDDRIKESTKCLDNTKWQHSETGLFV